MNERTLKSFQKKKREESFKKFFGYKVDILYLHSLEVEKVDLLINLRVVIIESYEVLINSYALYTVSSVYGSKLDQNLEPRRLKIYTLEPMVVIRDIHFT